MNDRENALAILNYEPYDRVPVVHFGYWRATLDKWAREGHITEAEAAHWSDGNAIDEIIADKLGFDFNWGGAVGLRNRLDPPIQEKVLEEYPDGSLKMLNGDGAIVMEKRGVTSIPTEVDHLLKDRASWESEFKPRLQFDERRVTSVVLNVDGRALPYEEEGLDYLRRGEWSEPLGVSCGSLYGVIRNWLGLTNSAYLQVDDPPLFEEIIDTVAELAYRCVEKALSDGATFDYGHFWEDICFRSGPLINPAVFREKVGPHYRRITDLLRDHGIMLASLDCDGKIDALVPIWLENGVSVMFPIEVGTWHASIAPWREEYGRELRGVGGMDKRVFARDYAAVDAEIERLRPLVDLGGYIPCVDHRIPPDATWENVQYYCERFRAMFG